MTSLEEIVSTQQKVVAHSHVDELGIEYDVERKIYLYKGKIWVQVTLWWYGF